TGNQKYVINVAERKILRRFKKVFPIVPKDVRTPLPDDRLLLFHSHPGKGVTVWDLAADKAAGTLDVDGNEYTVSIDGSRLAAIDGVNTKRKNQGVEIWDLATCQRLFRREIT